MGKERERERWGDMDGGRDGPLESKNECERQRREKRQRERGRNREGGDR